jgi:DNA replication protein DnaC
MDAGTFMILDKLRQQEPVTWEDIKLMFIVLPLIGMLIKEFPEWASKMVSWMNQKCLSSFSRKKETLELVGYEYMSHGGMTIFEYPEPVLALNHWLYKRKKLQKFKLFNETRNGDAYFEDIKKSLTSDTCAYLADCCSRTKIEDQLYIEITRNEKEYSDSGSKKSSCWTFSMILTSKKPNTIEPFITNVIREYKECKKRKNQNKLYHFIYRGHESDGFLQDCFTVNLLSDLSNNPNTETFEHLVNEHSEELIENIKLLRDVEYYRKNGLKRKKGWLFYGYPGCGKTASVMAIANMDQRHIIEIPLSRVKDNKDLEILLQLTKINNIDLSPDRVIYLFDEIDREMEGNTNNVSVTEEIQKNLANMLTIPTMSNKNDKLSMGSILSRLDGIGNYNGLILIATTNNKDKLDPAMYREMRLTPLFFQHLRKQDSITIIEKFYGRPLLEEEKACIPDRQAKLSPARLRVLLERYRKDIFPLLEELNHLI